MFRLFVVTIVWLLCRMGIIQGPTASLTFAEIEANLWALLKIEVIESLREVLGIGTIKVVPKKGAITGTLELTGRLLVNGTGSIESTTLKTTGAITGGTTITATTSVVGNANVRAGEALITEGELSGSEPLALVLAAGGEQEINASKHTTQISITAEAVGTIITTLKWLGGIPGRFPKVTVTVLEGSPNAITLKKTGSGISFIMSPELLEVKPGQSVQLAFAAGGWRVQSLSP